MKKIPRKREFIWPVWGNNGKMILDKGDIVGATAMWAVKQSPYNQPENLEAALLLLRSYLEETLTTGDLGFTSITIEELRVHLNLAFEKVPEIAAWNVPKKDSGQLFQGSSSRYHTTKPDYDFIDLCALSRNVSHTCGLEYFGWQSEEDTEEARNKTKTKPEPSTLPRPEP